MDEKGAERLIAVSSNERYFADDLTGFCARCGAVVYYRPHTPPVDERVCVVCFAKLPQDDMRFMVTRETLRELALYDLAGKGRPQ